MDPMLTGIVWAVIAGPMLGLYALPGKFTKDFQFENTSSVATAILSGLVVGEWKQASAKAKKLLYAGLGCMVAGILIISFGNKLALDAAASAPEVPAQ